MPRPPHSAWRQLRGAVHLAGSGFDRITEQIHAFHQAIAEIPFAALEHSTPVQPVSGATQLTHDGIATTVYATVREVGRVVFGAGTTALAALDRAGAVPAPPLRSAALDDVISAVNGIVGDFMAARRNPLAVDLGFYVAGQRLRLTRDALATAQPEATDRLAVFVHGLCCNESAWTRYVDADDPRSQPYANRLAAELGFTPYFARYNTGLHVSQNGRLLSRELTRLVAAHPVPVREIVVIGHSMGGLVSRAACHAAMQTDAAWAKRVSHVICLGAPHLGAPLERAVHLGTGLLEILPVTRPWATVLNVRSRGIQDLRHGFTADADWRGRDPRRQYRAGRTPIHRLPAARYHFIGSSIGANAADVIGRVVGDGLVRLSSSTARELADADTAALFGVHHIRLLNHPDVYREIRRRIA